MTDHDDEVTTDVDPEWIAAIRAEAAAPSPDAAAPDTATPNGTSPHGPSDTVDTSEPAERVAGTDWFDTELKWDAEATVGVSSGLIDRIRAEIDTERSPDTPVLPPPPARAPSAPDDAPQEVAATTAATVPVPPNVAPPAPTVAPPTPAPSASAPPASAPPTPAPVATPRPITTGEDAASTTVRWEPRQRLAMTAPVKESAAIVDHSRHPGLDRTKVTIAVIVAVTVLLVVWLVGRSGGDDPAPPAGTVPASSTPATPPPADDDSSGGGG